jgi:hypothetical protein
LVVREVFEVLYSPVKAFKGIVRKPEGKGLLLIFVLILLTAAVFIRISYSKWFVETANPDKDQWTESTSFWNSDGTISLDGTDRIVGNYSVKCFVSNGTSIWMRTTDIGKFNCSGDAGYKSLSFRIKWIHQNGKFPSSNATLRLFSSSESRYFELNIIHDISNSSNEWYNITTPISIGPGSQGWAQFGSPGPDWGNITGLEFRLNWLNSDAANLTMKIDDVYFGNYVVPFITTSFYNQWFISSLTATAVDFFISWLLYAALIWLFIKMFQGKTGPWKVLFIVIGYTFCNRMVQAPVDALLISMFPPLNFPLKALNPIAGEEGVASKLQSEIIEKWGFNTLPYTLSSFFTLGIYVWTIALGTIALRFLGEIEWKKAAAISGIAYIVSIFLRLFIPI